MTARRLRRAALLLAAAAAGAAWFAGPARAEGPAARREPSAGYAYPAGARRGTTVRVVVGGQNLAGADAAFVSGEGVRALVLRYEGGDRRLTGEERRELWWRIAERRRALGAGADAAEPARRRPAAPPKVRVDLPRHPWLDALDQLDAEDLDRLEVRFLRDDPRSQPNAQIAETVLVQVTVDPGAPPGDRDLRLSTRGGLTNPLRFQVGSLPEEREVELVGGGAPTLPVLSPPVLVNGQILPGDEDRVLLRLRAGQRLVVEARARRLVPFLADAVPGWFQAALSLRDGDGREVAFADDFRFDPDPVLLCEVPRDGVYTLEIRDALFRGREDFVYRLSVGEAPFVTGMFPLGGRLGEAAAAALAGWNLPARSLPLDTTPGGDGVRWAAAGRGDRATDPLPYAVDALAEVLEAEPNDGIGEAQRVQLPCTVNGRIGRPGDADWFGFRGRAGDEVAVEVRGRRLLSPLDSLVRLSDEGGRVLAWNDDYGDGEAGLLTHRADSFLLARLPLPGLYFVEVRDAQGRGGEEFAYRLRVGPPRPDFELRATPSSLTVPAGRAVPFEVHAVRREGFAGEIAVSLVDPPGGFLLGGARIPAGCDRIHMTLTAPPGGLDAPVALRLEGRARVGREAVARPVQAADERMQAFLYRHLVPAQELLVEVRGKGGEPAALDLPDGARVRIPSGGRAPVRFRVARGPRLRAVRLQLLDPPPGVTVERASVVAGGVEVVLAADRRPDLDRFEGNLVLEAVADLEARGRARDGEAPPPPRTVSLGVLPAIPVEIR